MTYPQQRTKITYRPTPLQAAISEYEVIVKRGENDTRTQGRIPHKGKDVFVLKNDTVLECFETMSEARKYIMTLARLKANHHVYR